MALHRLHSSLPPLIVNEGISLILAIDILSIFSWCIIVQISTQTLLLHDPLLFGSFYCIYITVCYIKHYHIVPTLNCLHIRITVTSWVLSIYILLLSNTPSSFYANQYNIIQLSHIHIKFIQSFYAS